MSFQTVIEKYRKIAFSQRDKGERFERLMQAYLLTDPVYSNKFQYVWMWNEFPNRKDFGGKDVGIDLVALTFEGEYWAVQCKCFQEDSLISKGDVDSFLATSSKSFNNSKLERVEFSHRLWLSTTNHWGINASEAIKNQSPPVSRLNFYELEQAAIDWDKLDKGLTGYNARTTKKTLFQHQRVAVDNVHNGFKKADRGKLIMACGTGKTFTALRIAEEETNGNGLVLFLVPSIALLGQTLREWSSDAEDSLNPVCICSDPRIAKHTTKYEDSLLTSVVDLALPASTNVDQIVSQLEHSISKKEKGMTVVFSTYQSIEVIANAQRELKKRGIGSGRFDLIICDEAHRTTGVALTPEDSSAFIKVHDNNFMNASKRLYMTATPRLYSDDAKSKAAQADAILCSMDDENIYGEELYRIGFGKAVEDDLLSDYKVLILTLSDEDITPQVQSMMANPESEISTDDATKLIGCVNALSKQVLGDEGLITGSDPDPMKRAVAFCQNIKVSKRITKAFNATTDAYLDTLNAKQRESMVEVASKHIDGTMGAPERDALLGWLKSTSADTGECRVLNNVRCLSEGVDVPSLDAVLFLSARNSQVDVVQSVGRVMRKAPGKKYGYIIIPVVIPSGVEASKALDDNTRFKVVWTVLNALRAHDDRFNATINKINLNKKKPGQIIIGGIGGGDREKSTGDKGWAELEHQISIQFEHLKSTVFAKMVQKVGDRVYWEKWAKDVAIIAARQIERITFLVGSDSKHQTEFDKFLSGLKKNINPSINQAQAIEMLSQHIITQPVFEALFEGYSFVKNNPVSIAMQGMMEILEDQTFAKDSVALGKFYDSVKMRAEGIDNAEGKQKIIVELYDKFFKTAFPQMVEQLGIVYTPVEVVDFIINSVNDVLKKEFNRSVTDENVHILDPFTGTGTFITRLLQSGLIDKKDLLRKYTSEIHANEIVLLAYYIAAINVENAFHDILGDDSFTPFDGICLTDTFQLGETDDSKKLFSDMFPQNSARVVEQKNAPVQVIIGNPPYSVGQKSANDNAQNQSYPRLDHRISMTYVKKSKATSIKAMYDAYIKAFRWSSDRLDPENGGIIAYVTNGGWLDGNSADGFRIEIEREFTSIWVFNLRGNQRTSGELSRKEGGKIFGSGSRTPITITLLVKNPSIKLEKAEVHHYDIGDYLNQEEKLGIIKKFNTLSSSEMLWEQIIPNEHGDWINQRKDTFTNFIPINAKKKFDSISQTYFIVHSIGIISSRDVWVYNSSSTTVEILINSMIDNYNAQLKKFLKKKKSEHNLKVVDFIDRDPEKISWSSSLIPEFERGNSARFVPNAIRVGLYRPFFKQRLYIGHKMIHRQGHFDYFFPTPDVGNRVICISASYKDGSVLITDQIPDFHMNGDTQAFPLYYYEKTDSKSPSLFNHDAGSKYMRRDGISDFILKHTRKQYGVGASGKGKLSKEDIFYYVYGYLHSPLYRTTFANDLNKSLPRLPLVVDVRDFWKFSKAGRALAELHIEYETVPPYKGVKMTGESAKFFEVTKMRFPKKDEKHTIIYNRKITITDIPDKAYQYVVNGKSAIEWIMERYQITTHKASTIKNNPNDWAKEIGKPRYILDLLLSIINVSVKTVDIIEGLPKLDFDK
jgi:predicted helicase